MHCTRLICKGLALGLTALGLAAGGALAEDEYLIRAEAENGTLLGRAQIAATGTSVSRLEHDGDGVAVTLTFPKPDIMM